MPNFWLVDQHGSEGPTALVETNGSLKIVKIARFGPGITELDDQQAILDKVLGRVAPTLKPFVPAGQLDEEGVPPHDDLDLDQTGNIHHGGPGTSTSGLSSGRVGGGPSNKGSRGDR